MKLFDVYPLFPITIVKGKGCKVWDEQGQEYLDFYGGHADEMGGTYYKQGEYTGAFGTQKIVP